MPPSACLFGSLPLALLAVLGTYTAPATGVPAPAPGPSLEHHAGTYQARAPSPLAQIHLGTTISETTLGSRSSDDSSGSTWQQYVRAPSSTLVRPARVIASWGNVSNPDALLGGTSSQGPTVLSRMTTDSAVPCLTVDFGQNVVGLLNIDFAGAVVSPATKVTPGYPSLQLAFSETLEFLTNRSDFTRSDNGDTIVHNGADQIAVQPKAYTWTDRNGCEYNGNQVCSDGLHGFRYVLMCLSDNTTGTYASTPYTSSYGEVSISSVSLTYKGYLGTPDTFTGWFECSDTNLTQWWYDGVYTNDQCIGTFLGNETEPRNANSPSLQGKLVLFDGAKRDRDPYVGDIAVSGLTVFVSHNVPQVVTNVIGDLADHQDNSTYPGWIPPASIVGYALRLFDYPLWWVKCAYDLLYYTGDLNFVNTYWHTLVEVLDVYYPANTDSTSNLLVKPAGFGDYGFLGRNGTITYFNALYVLALKQGAAIATAFSQPTYATKWQQRASTVAQSLMSTNWDSSNGAFFDGSPCPLHSSGPCPTHPQDGNSIAILAGVTGSMSGTNGTQQAESILSYLAAHNARSWGNAFFDNDQLLDNNPGADAYSNRVYAFLSYFELAARFSTSRATAATGYEELRRLYGTMAAGDPGVTFWEGIGPNGSPYEGSFTSMSHGWSTGVTPLLTNYLLGVQPASPGFATWTVKPVVEGSGVTWARGAVPVPGGKAIKVAWAVNGEGTFQLSVDAPQGTNGTLSVPVGSGHKGVWLNGTLAFDLVGRTAMAFGATLVDGYVTLSVGSSNHTVVVGNSAPSSAGSTASSTSSTSSGANGAAQGGSASSGAVSKSLHDRLSWSICVLAWASWLYMW